MCTAFSFKTSSGSFFGRNMDLAYNFNQSPLFIPRNALYLDRASGEKRKMNKAVLGMGTLIDSHPSMAEAMNEYGLACAGLNFAQNAFWEKECVPGKTNLPPYDFILWVLGNFENVHEVKAALTGIELVDIPINENTPCPTLHWFISDRQGKSLVVEKTENGIKAFDNPVGVMTNDPCFDWHLTNLRQYMKLSPEHPAKVNWSEDRLRALGLGSGTLGMPGDFGSVSRFVRIAFARAHMPEISSDMQAVSQCFHMLEYVAMVKGCVKLPNGVEDMTLYSSCMDMDKGIYYYRCHDNSRINAVCMGNEDPDGSIIKVLPYFDTQDIKFIN